MSTEAQVAANRTNAEHSSGPKTEEGKAASSRNHFSHGLCTYDNIFFILPFESPEAYSILRATLLSEHRPETETERILVDRMAQHHWLRNRAEAFESGCFKEDGTLDDKRLALFMRYRTSHERAFEKCLNELLKLRAEKRKAEIGFGIAKAREGRTHPRIGAARNGEKVSRSGPPARGNQDRPPTRPHLKSGNDLYHALHRHRKGEEGRLILNPVYDQMKVPFQSRALY
jgi:hypothetical protein